MPPSFAARLAGFAARHALDEARTAEALGVPIFTARKWATGTRSPSAAAVRLLDVLETLEALAPAILAAFLPPVRPVTPRTRGRVKKLTSEIGHVEKSGSTGSTTSTPDSVMSENPV
jgi:electron transfer flavoprotein alpha/beta subunit